jgi:hypothetical protein
MQLTASFSLNPDVAIYGKTNPNLGERNPYHEDYHSIQTEIWVMKSRSSL